MLKFLPRMKKDQIIARFRALFPDVKLSNKRLNALAVKLEAKDLQDEAAIDAQLHAANEILPFEEIAASDDTIANLNHKLKTIGKPAQKEGGEPADDPKPADESPTDKMLKMLLAEVQTLKADKIKATMQEKLSANEKLKSIPKAFYKGRSIPEKDDDIESFVNEIETDWTEFQQESTNESFSKQSKPVGSAGSGTSKADPAIAAHAARKAQAALLSKK